MRTTPEAVGDVINLRSGISVLPSIANATVLVDWLVTKDTNLVLTSGILERIECNLAAHFYAHKVPQYQQEMTGRSGGMKMGQNSMVLMGTPWGQDACLLDVTGTLAERSQDAATGLKRVAGGQWLGTDCQ